MELQFIVKIDDNLFLALLIAQSEYMCVDKDYNVCIKSFSALLCTIWLYDQ